MKYTEPVYRPPYEYESLLLQVTVGCSHNKCSFCTMYRDVPFAVETLEQIERDLHEARWNIPHVDRVYLVNADPFVLSAEMLAQIAEKINQILPEVTSIGMYSSILNIMTKSDEELLRLRALKINGFNIGVESGLSGMMERMGKGYDLATAKAQLARLKKAGIDYTLNLIIGGAGSERSKENALANANLINETKPSLVFVAQLHIDEDSELYKEVQAGKFIENSVRENLEEEITLLEHLTLSNCHFYGMHTSNLVPVQGDLPGAKEDMLARLREGFSLLDDDLLDERNVKKGREGNIIFQKSPEEYLPE